MRRFVCLQSTIGWCCPLPILSLFDMFLVDLVLIWHVIGQSCHHLTCPWSILSLFDMSLVNLVLIWHVLGQYCPYLTCPWSILSLFDMSLVNLALVHPCFTNALTEGLFDPVQELFVMIGTPFGRWSSKMLTCCILANSLLQVNTRQTTEVF